MMDDTQVFDTSWNLTQPDVEQDLGPVGLFKIGGETLKIYSGHKYTVGRGSQASLMVPVKSLSKKHIEIEYLAGTHLICDLGSKNRTRRGKLILLPGVKYELLDMTTNQYKLVLGDTEATYHYIQPEEIDKINEDDGEEEGNIVEPTKTDVGELLDNQPASAISHMSFDRQPQSSTPSKVLSKVQILPELSEEIVSSEQIQTVEDPEDNVHITGDQITEDTHQIEDQEGVISEADESDFILATQVPQLDETTNDSISFVEDSPVRDTDFSIVLDNVPETPHTSKVTAGLLRTPSTDLSNISDLNTRNELNTLKLLQQSTETIPDSQPMSQFILGVGDVDRSENSSPVIGGIEEAAGFNNEDEETDCEDNPAQADDWDQETQCFDMPAPDSTMPAPDSTSGEVDEVKDTEEVVEENKDDDLSKENEDKMSESTENVTENEDSTSTENSKEADKDELVQNEGSKDMDDTQKITGEALTESMINDLVDEIKTDQDILRKPLTDQDILRTPMKKTEQEADDSMMSLTLGSQVDRAVFSPSSQAVPCNKHSEKADTDQTTTEIEKEAEDIRFSESQVLNFQPDEDESTSDSVKTTVLTKVKTTRPTRSVRAIVEEYRGEQEQISNKKSGKVVESKDEDQPVGQDDDVTENEGDSETEDKDKKAPTLRLEDTLESQEEDKDKKAPTLRLEETLESQAEENNMWKTILDQSISDANDAAASEGLSINVSDYTAPIGGDEPLDDLREDDTCPCTLDLDSVQWTSGNDNFVLIKNEPDIEVMNVNKENKRRLTEIESIFVPEEGEEEKEDEIEDVKPNVGTGRPSRSTRGQKPKRFSGLKEIEADVKIKDVAGISTKASKVKREIPEPIKLDTPIVEKEIVKKGKKQPPPKRQPPPRKQRAKKEPIAKKEPPAKKPVRASRATKKSETKRKGRDSSCEPPEGMLFRMVGPSPEEECLDESSSGGSGDSYEVPVDLLFPMKKKRRYYCDPSMDSSNSSEDNSESEEEEDCDDYSENEKKPGPKERIASKPRVTRAKWQAETDDKVHPSKKQSTSRVTRDSSQQYPEKDESVTRTSKRMKLLPSSAKEQKQLQSSVNEDNNILSSVKKDKELPGSVNEDNNMLSSVKKDKKLPGSVNEDNNVLSSIKKDKELPGSVNEEETINVKKELNKDRVTILKLDSVEALLKRRRQVRDKAMSKGKGKKKTEDSDPDDSLPDCGDIEGTFEKISDYDDEEDDEIQLLTGPVKLSTRPKPKGKEPMLKSEGKVPPEPTRTRKSSSVSVQKEPEMIAPRRSKRVSGETPVLKGKKVSVVIPCVKKMSPNQTDSLEELKPPPLPKGKGKAKKVKELPSLSESSMEEMPVDANTEGISDSLEVIAAPRNERRQSKKVNVTMSDSLQEINPPPLPKGKGKAKKVKELPSLSESSMEEMPEPAVKDRRKSELGKRKKEEVVLPKGRGKRSKISSVDSQKDNVTSPVRTKEVVEQLTPSRRSVASPKVTIVFTGVDVSEATKRTIKALSGTVSDDIKSCSHLITDKVKRTVKLLCAIGRGIPIVNDKWIQQSKACKSFVDSEEYIIKDKAAEKLYMFDLQRAINSARKTACLDGWSFHPTKSCKPDANQLDDILSCNGGVLVRKAPKCFVENLVVLAARTENVKVFKNMGFPVCTTELILTGILRQKLSITEFKL